MKILTAVLCVLVGAALLPVASAPPPPPTDRSLILLTDGLRAENLKRPADATAKYLAAYAAAQGDLALQEDDRLAIERKYVWALLTDPTKYHEALLTYAKMMLIEQSVSQERRLLALSVAGKLLHRDLTYPEKDRDAFLASITRELSAPMMVWDAQSQGAFIMSMTSLGKEIAVGAEDTGVWIYDRSTGARRQFTTKDGLGDNDIYALAYDSLGRLWAGHLNHGVSVYNGKTWRNYGVVDGPIGARVFSIATSPVDGDVWIATDAGVTRYSLKQDTWRSFTTADGLPSNQATCLTFDRRGTLYIGTACDGIAIGALRDNYSHWRRVTGPRTPPNADSGQGIPSSLINALLVTSNGTVWAGTTCGLARSSDSGVNWKFQRGKDWAAKITGLWRGARVNPSSGNDLLLEDYVTCLTEGGDGNMYIGFRQKSYEIRNPETGARLYPQSDDPVTTLYLSTLLPLENGYVLLARYGDGIRQEMPFAGGVQRKDTLPISMGNSPRQAASPTPSPPPSAAALDGLTRIAQSRAQALKPGTGYFLGQDWTSQGDWVGRYGRQFAVLCAARSPLDHDIQSVFPFNVTPELGPHHSPGDGLRRWVHWAKTDNPRCLYDPIPGYRRQSEWDDHGEDYFGGSGYEGPDIWMSVTVPEGAHRVSLYFMNKDGHDGANRYRDYLVELRQFAPTPELASELPAIAHTRVRDFWGGVYQEFILAGPGKFWLKIGKNNSLNTIVSSVFIDQLTGPKQPTDTGRLGWMGGVRVDPPDPDAAAPTDPYLLDKILSGAPAPEKAASPSLKDRASLAAARRLWKALDDSEGGSPVLTRWQYRLLAYRTAAHCGAPVSLLSAWRWKLGLWTEEDRDQFAKTMASAHDALLAANPQMKGLDY